MDLFKNKKRNEVSQVDVKLIKVVSSLSRVKTDVKDLVESIDTIGLINPIIVNKNNELLAGARRLQAVKELGYQAVDVLTIDINELDQELITIDENLMRKDLSSVEKDTYLYRRKMIYEQKFPETKQYFAGRIPKKTLAFTTETAKKLEVSRKSIELAINRAEKAAPYVTNLRKEGKLSNTQTDEIVKLSPNIQDMVANDLTDRKVADIKNIVQRIKGLSPDKAKEALSDYHCMTYSVSLEKQIKQTNRILDIHLTRTKLFNSTQDKGLLTAARKLKDSLVVLTKKYKKPNLRKATDEHPQLQG